MALIMVLGLLPGLLEPVETLLLPLLLRIPLLLELSLLLALPSLGLSEVPSLQRLLLQPCQGILAQRVTPDHGRTLQADLLPS